MELYQSHSLPLSKRMMPQNLSQFMGQKHLTAPGRPIYTMLENKMVHSMIFYGPPATGKTSLAEIIARESQCHFIMSSALTLDSEEIRNHLKTAQQKKTEGYDTILFIDEIHRLYKPKQDAFLSAIENGLVHIIGATTENPYFIMQPALRSRVFIYEFKNLSDLDKRSILTHALQEDEFLNKLDISLEEGATETLLELAADPRMLLNTLEMTILSKGPGEKWTLNSDDFRTILNRSDTRYSSDEGHYDTISAFIKSVRGSDPDAAVYYLMVMLESGEDPLFIARRLIILAGEDIGLAYPEGLSIAVSAYTALEKIGMPEGVYPLIHVTTLLAGVPKSNSTTLAMGRARRDIESGKRLDIPSYLREASFKGAKDLGRGIGYKYPHDYPNHWVDQKYLSEDLRYYEPGELGFEKKIKDWLSHLKKD